ncbi:MAG: T9SS type A sorting domain-containing protein [Bacteroidota bacterium]
MKTATRLLALVAVLAPVVFSATAEAQTRLTVREIIRVPQANLDQLQSLGASATDSDVDDLIDFEQLGNEVQFTAVVLSNPFNSGLASWNNDASVPGRVHVFVRDTTANSQGYDGMNVQLVDGTASVLDMEVGVVYDIIGTVGEFNNVIQVSPTVFEEVDEYQNLGLPDAIVEPLVISTGDLNRSVGDDLYQANWANFNDLNNQYVRFESAVVEASVADNTGRPNWQFSSAGSDVVVNGDDISLRYRNDRSGDPMVYPNPPYGTRPTDDPYVPPTAGAVIEVQGFAALRAFDFDNDISTAAMSVAPFEDEDLQATASPPIFGGITGPADVPGNAPVTISAEVTQGSNPIASVELDYEASTGETGAVMLTDNGSGVFSGDIPALPDGAFVTYSVTATDTQGDSSESATQSYRVLFDGIDSIEDVQLTASGGPGSSPFAGITTTNIDIEAVVMSDVTTSGLLTLQDDESLAPWTGIFVEVTTDIALLELAPGDRVTVSEATIAEAFGVTRLEDATLSVTSSGEPFPYKEVTTDILQDADVAEAHEGIALRFNSVTITDVNADGDDSEEGFGEFQFSSDGTEDNELRADDVSDAVPQDFNIMNLTLGENIGAIQGLWWFSFGNYKLAPESPDDIGFPVSNEAGTPAGGFALDRAYPNPFARTATIAYEVGEAGPVALRVYDALGRQVATLVETELAAGRYEATLDARGLAAGVYVYRLTSSSGTLTGRVTLVK